MRPAARGRRKRLPPARQHRGRRFVTVALKFGGAVVPGTVNRNSMSMAGVLHQIL